MYLLDLKSDMINYVKQLELLQFHQFIQSQYTFFTSILLEGWLEILISIKSYAENHLLHGNMQLTLQLPHTSTTMEAMVSVGAAVTTATTHLEPQEQIGGATEQDSTCTPFRHHATLCNTCYVRDLFTISGSVLFCFLFSLDGWQLSPPSSF